MTVGPFQHGGFTYPVKKRQILIAYIFKQMSVLNIMYIIGLYMMYSNG